MNALHTLRFPNEADEYREARNQLLHAEIELRRKKETVELKKRKDTILVMALNYTREITSDLNLLLGLQYKDSRSNLAKYAYDYNRFYVTVTRPF